MARIVPGDRTMKFTIGTMLAAPLLAAGALASEPAAAHNVVANYDSIGAALTAQGIEYEIVEVPDRVLKADLQGYTFGIFLSDCDDKGKNCQSVQFYTGIDTPTPITAEAANNYTRTVRWGRVYREDDAVSMEMGVNLAGKGISRELFADYLDLWGMMVPSFMFWAEYGTIPGE